MPASTESHIILLAHGSSDPNWQATFEALARPTCESIPGAVVGYMELCEPSLEHQIQSLQQRGARQITVVPLFLARGRHLRKDVPAMLRNFEVRYGVSLELTAPVGEHPALGQSIRTIVEDILDESAELNGPSN